MANASVVDLDADLVCLWWCNLDILNGKVLAGLPCNGSLFSSTLAISSFSLYPSSCTYNVLYEGTYPYFASDSLFPSVQDNQLAIHFQDSKQYSFRPWKQVWSRRVD
jgi:hypothetical protein